jgi:hypothetical protein
MKFRGVKPPASPETAQHRGRQVHNFAMEHNGSRKGQREGVSMKKTLLSVSWGFLLLLLLAQGVTCPGAFAQKVYRMRIPVTRADRFGAIAYSESSGSWGTSYDYGSRADAEQSALSRCARGDCQVRIWFRNACGALAVGKGNCMGWAWASDKAEAQRKALKNCRQYGTGCSVKCWACTRRR